MYSLWSCPPHPLEILPLGNSFLRDSSSRSTVIRSSSLGPHFHRLDDALLGYFYQHHLTPPQVAILGQVSKYWYALTTVLEEYWREQTLRRLNSSGDKNLARFYFNLTWKQTFVNLFYGTNSSTTNNWYDNGIHCAGIYSDFLYRPWQCASVDWSLLALTPNEENAEQLDGLKHALAASNYAELPRLSLSVEEFQRRFEDAQQPVILAGACKDWKAVQGYPEFFNLLKEKCNTNNTIFQAEALSCTLPGYLSYALGTRDEAPLYLFDKQFLHSDWFNATTNNADYFGGSLPHFSQDLFNLLPQDQRPDWKWIIIGPYRSGSNWHIDPNGTSAWNAVITGSKWWCVFPPDTPPPGVFTNEDASEVTSPVSLAEWMLSFFPTPNLPETNENRKRRKRSANAAAPMHGVCKAGDVMFIPSGWWHLVLNLEFSVAITQNYVSMANLEYVARFLRLKKDQISGVKDGVDLWGAFKEAMIAHHLETWKSLEEKLQKEETTKKQTTGGSSWWDRLVMTQQQELEEKPKPFSFHFELVQEQEGESQLV